MALCLSTVLVSDTGLKSNKDLLLNYAKVAFKCKKHGLYNCIKYVNKEWTNYAEGFVEFFSVETSRETIFGNSILKVGSNVGHLTHVNLSVINYGRGVADVGTYSLRKGNTPAPVHARARALISSLHS